MSELKNHPTPGETCPACSNGTTEIDQQFNNTIVCLKCGSNWPSKTEAEQPVEVNQEIASLKNLVSDLQRQIEAGLDNYLRLKADFQNEQKRLNKHRDEEIKYANTSVLRSILPTIDALEKAIDTYNEISQPFVTNPIFDGIKMTIESLLAELNKFGVIPIVSKGQKFDPSLHRAVHYTEADEEPDTVIGEVLKGYMLHDRLLRAAAVVVAKAKSVDQPPIVKTVDSSQEIVTLKIGPNQKVEVITQKEKN